MLSMEAPSDELPKNRLAVLTEKPSRGGSTATPAASGAAFESVNGGTSSDIATSYCGYCGSGGAFSASASSGSSGAGAAAGIAAAVFAPITEAFDVEGSSFEGEASAGAAISGVTLARRSPFSARLTLGKSDA